MYEILYGHKPNAPEPAEFHVFRKIAEQLLKLDQVGKAIVREIATLGVKNGLDGYLPYLFFAFHAPGNTRNWPNMPQHLSADLHMGRWILVASMAVPNYTREIVTPPLELERDVDQVLKDLAVWCGKDLRNSLAVRYIRILKNNMANFNRVSDLPDAGSKITVIKGAFENNVDRNPANFPGGGGLPRMIRFMGI